MAEHWGLEAICKQLGVKDHKTVAAYYRDWGLPLIKRRRGSHPRLWWWIDDYMLLAWKLKMAQIGRNKWVREKPQVSDAMMRRVSGEVDDAQASSKPDDPGTRDDAPLEMVLESAPVVYSKPVAKPICTCGTSTPCTAH